MAEILNTVFCTIPSTDSANSLNFILTYEHLSSSIADNSSVMRIRAYLTNTTDNEVQSLPGLFSVSNTNIYTDGYVVPADDSILLGTFDITVPHIANGYFPKTEVPYSLYSEHWADTLNGIAQIPFDSAPKIPRASVLSTVRDINIGESCYITWVPTLKTLYYKIEMSIDGNVIHSNVLYPNTLSTYIYSSYTIPYSALSYIPNSKYGKIDVALGTYLDAACEEQVGSTSNKIFTLTVLENENTKPTIDSFSISFTSDSNLINNWDIGISGMSRVRMQASASAKYGASITSYVISGDVYAKTEYVDSSNTSLDYTGGIINSTGKKDFKVYAVDSRGFKSDVSTRESSKIYKYTKPYVRSFDVIRNTGSTSASIEAYWMYDSEIGPGLILSQYQNPITVIITEQYDDGSWHEIQRNTYEYGKINATYSHTPATRSNYNYRLDIIDAIGNSAYSTTVLTNTSGSVIPSNPPLLDFRDGGKGLGIGKTVGSNKLEVGLPTDFDDTVNMDSNLTVLGSTNARGVSATSLSVSGNSSLSGTTTVNNLNVTGSVTGIDTGNTVNIVSSTYQNLNNYTTTNWYYFKTNASKSVSNGPPSTGSAFFLEVVNMGDSSLLPSIMQKVTYIVSNNPLVFVRTKYSSWSNWVSLI